MTYEQCDEFTQGYIKCALWLFDDDDPDPSGEWDREDLFLSSLAPETIDSMAADCKRFQEANADVLERVYGNVVTPFDESEAVGDNDNAPYTPARAGHDFWLTRNRHGAGYWDRDLGGEGDYLTEMAHEFRECDLYRGDDGLIYVS